LPPRKTKEENDEKQIRNISEDARDPKYGQKFGVGESKSDAQLCTRNEGA